MGRLELDLEVLIVNLGRSAHLLSLLLNSVMTCFNNVVYCSGIDVFSSHQ